MSCNEVEYIDKQDLLDTIGALSVDGTISERDANYLINYIIAQGKLNENQRRDIIQIRRGLKENLPRLAYGELAFCTDTEELFIGTKDGNVLISKGDGTNQGLRKLEEYFYWEEGRPLVGNFKLVKEDREYNGFPVMVKTNSGRLIVAYSSGKQHALGSDLNRRVKYKYSDNGGTLWSEEFTMLELADRDQFISGMGVAPNGNIIAFIRTNAEGNTNSLNHVLVSSNDGVTFTVTEILTNSSSPLIGRSSVPNMIVEIDDGKLMSLTSAFYQGNFGLQAIFSLNDGVKWTEAVTIIPETFPNTASIPTEIRPVYLGNGQIIAIGRNRNNNLYQLTSTDNGLTWKVEISNIDDCDENPVGIVHHVATDIIAIYYFDRKSNEFKTRIVQREQALVSPKAWSLSRVVTYTGSYRQTIDIGYTTSVLIDGTTLDVVSAIYTSRDVRALNDTTPKRTGVVVIFDKIDTSQLYPSPSGKQANAFINSNFLVTNEPINELRVAPSGNNVIAPLWRISTTTPVNYMFTVSHLPNSKNTLNIGLLDIVSTTYLITRVEDVKSFEGQWVNISFNAKANKAYNLGIVVRQVSGSGTVNLPTRNVNINTVNNRYSVPYYIPKRTNALGATSYLEIQFLMVPAQGNAEVQFTNLQMSVGQRAIPYYQEKEGTELVNIQRYRTIFSGGAGFAPIGVGYATATNTALISLKFPTTMRALPSLIIENPAHWSVAKAGASYNCSSLIIKPSYISPDGVCLEATLSGTPLTVGEPVMLLQNGTGRIMTFNAEL